jgi:hypothetical protein
MWKSYGSVNHRALRLVYELDTGNPKTYIEILSTIDVYARKQKYNATQYHILWK